ncbi:hypothetical protein D9M71_608340 [compost metagenome]
MAIQWRVAGAYHRIANARQALTQLCPFQAFKGVVTLLGITQPFQSCQLLFELVSGKAQLKTTRLAKLHVDAAIDRQHPRKLGP